MLLADPLGNVVLGNSDFEIVQQACLGKAGSVFCEAEGKLAHPYVDPGGPYSKNLWDWDSYWVLLALSFMAEQEETLPSGPLQALLIRHGCGVLANLFDHQGNDGSLPILLSPEDADWFDCTTEPTNNMAKPIVAQMIKLLLDNGLEKDRAKPWLPNLARFHSEASC